MQLTIGTILQGGKYRIDKVLGQGGFGITYLATQDILDRKVAIKEFFFKEYCDRAEDSTTVTLGTQSNKDLVHKFLKKFLKEAKTISKLHHPNIIQIYDIFTENNTAYYVMEYIDGKSLGDIVKEKGAIPEQTALGYIGKVGDALDYLHLRNINHLDIKPGNIMLRNNDSEIVLIDFGVSKQYDTDTNEGTTTTPVGISHGYSPMEQYIQNGVQLFSPQSDVYALAATLYKILTMVTPPSAIIVNDEGLPVDCLQSRGISQHVINAILSAMKPKSQRTNTVMDFISQLNDEEEDEDITNVEIDTPSDIKENDKKLGEKKTTDNNDIETDIQQDKTGKEKNKAKLYIIIISAFMLLGGSFAYIKNLSDEKEKEEVKVEKVTQVKDVTIVLTKGHESKRNYKYTGQVNDQGVPNGKGTAIYPETKSSSSCTFVGEFNDGIPAKGVMTFSSGVKYDGLFDNNGYYQRGTLWDNEGYYFEGTFKDGNPYNGTWYSPQGKVESKVINGK